MLYQSEFHSKAIKLFERFAERHQLIYNVEVEPEVDILWTFPVQSKLALPVTLCLQGDELNFGVEKFWSHYFPFEQVAEHFDRTLNMWVNGDARITIVSKTGRLLQVSEGSNWRTIYRCGGFFFALAQTERIPKHSNTRCGRFPVKPFTQTFTPTLADIDELGHVKNAVWVRWIQDVTDAT